MISLQVLLEQHLCCDSWGHKESDMTELRGRWKLQGKDDKVSSSPELLEVVPPVGTFLQMIKKNFPRTIDRGMHLNTI